MTRCGEKLETLFITCVMEKHSYDPDPESGAKKEPLKGRQTQPVSQRYKNG